MADTLYTDDGKMHVLIGDDAFARLVGDYMGVDARNRVRALDVEIAREEIRANSDLDCYEESLYENSDRFQEIQELTEKLEFALSASRLNRSKMLELIQGIHRLAGVY